MLIFISIDRVSDSTGKKIMDVRDISKDSVTKSWREGKKEGVTLKFEWVDKMHNRSVNTHRKVQKEDINLGGGKWILGERR